MTEQSTNTAQRAALVKVLAVNAVLAIALFIAGQLADSSGLMANALDNLSDALTYAVSYFAVTRSQRWKAGAAGMTGIMLLILAIGVLADAWRRYVVGSDPVGPTMVVMAFVAVALNYWCIRILRSHRSADVNLRAAWTMSLNDFASNFGIVLAGVLVAWTGSRLPDLLVAGAIAAVAGYGGLKTLKDAYSSRRTA
ncbi:Co/Zn/Cd efflux system component [Pseudoxanthomonas japonensis]|jgi:cobalt-zinc-cadmium efflux system protein|uniref:cation transporter n=1 Tax=Pseudoxanthomonas TaxID=83618 RepID=UPI00078129F5|nr:MULTISPECIES: cation transporter [Pseudoxanthomonas]MBA3929225.1 cation transporter [Xanthomonas sp.]MBL8257959.1 cation transporter [Pseudoxanthomonas mexicana]MDR7067594.1 Co/Zn/Cd efflux system component [Pseudoxanthomonas japonensis]